VAAGASKFIIEKNVLRLYDGIKKFLVVREDGVYCCLKKR
jgi:hypothetical protein